MPHQSPRPITLGLISDTHMGDRWRTLPPTLPAIFADVDLILHAGDVGELWVLDRLSQIAPVVAVHGNDELAGAPDVLPTQQVIHAAGQRLLLHHGHRPDHADEMAQRQIDDWRPKLAYWAGQAQAVGASIVVYGHTHIPWHIEFDGVTIVNPGAIAGGNHYTRQRVQTVARLVLAPDAAPAITYYDVGHNVDQHEANGTGPARALPVRVDPAAGFLAAFRQVAEPLITDDLATHRDWLTRHAFDPAPRAFVDALRPLVFRCLDDPAARIDTADVVDQLLAAPAIPATVKAAVRDWSARLGYVPTQPYADS